MAEKEPSSPTLAESRPVSPAKEETQNKPDDAIEDLGTAKLWIVMGCLYLTIFLMALDKTIIATAIPRITNTFNSLADIGWYGSSYMLTLCAFQLLWGRIYTFYNPKIVFLVAILVFEIGSAVCGAAPSSIAFILGRTIAGAGCSGLMNGAIVIIMCTVPLAKRPMFQGLIGAVFGVASVAGPLLGGVFTEKVSWRWCFYINLPCGAVAIVVLIFMLHLPQQKKEELTVLEKFKRLDPLGTLLFVPSMVCLLLALQWGGTTYAWSSWRVILLLVLFPVLFFFFMALQIWYPGSATVPIKVITQRTIAAGSFYSFTQQASMLVITYYIPLFFQVLKNYSPISSGLATLPSILSLVIGVILAGALVQRIGYPSPFMIVGSVLSSIGAGLISTWQISAKQGAWIGFQVLFGFGVGISMQQPNMLAQIILPRKEATMGVSFMMLMQNLGGAIFISAAQNIFADDLASSLGKIPGVDLTPEQVVQMGATKIKELVPQSSLGLVLVAYRNAIQKAFYIGVGLACFSMVGAVLVEWVSVKKPEAKGSAKPTEEVVAEKKAKEVV